MCICKQIEILYLLTVLLSTLLNKLPNGTETTDNGLMSLRSFRLIEELQRMFNETKSSQMPENAKEKSEEKKSPKMENSKVIAEFRILSNSVLEYLVAYLLYHLHSPRLRRPCIFSFLLFFSVETMFKQRN